MMGDPVFIVLKYTSWLDTAAYERRILGAIVKKYANPTVFEPRAKDKPALTYYDADEYPLITGSLTNFAAQPGTATTTTTAASIGKVAGFDLRGSKKDALRLRGKTVRWTRLAQEDIFFESLRADASVRATVPKWIKFINPWPPCVVVGVMVCDDVDLAVELGSESERGGHLTAPVAAIAGAAAGAPGVLDALGGGDLVDPGLEVKRVKEVSRDISGTMTGSRIFALELRKVTTALFSKLLELGDPLEVKGKMLSDHDDEAAQIVAAAEKVEADDMVIRDFTETELKDIDDSF